MLSVRFSEDAYEVNEGAGTVTICVQRIGESANPITVTVSSREISPASATGRQE